MIFGGIAGLENVLELIYREIEVGLIRLDSLAGVWVPLTVGPWLAFVMTVIVFLMIARSRPLVRCAGAAVLLCCLLVGLTSERSVDPRITFLNVGHGDAAMVSDGYGALLVDGGGKGAGWYRVLESIRRQHHSGALHILVSHGDEDHGAGLLPVLERVEEVSTLFYGAGTLVDPLVRKLVQVALIRGVQVEELVAGDQVVLSESLSLNVLWPQDEHALTSMSRNNRSLVVSVNLLGTSVLFTGDIEATTENILKEYFSAGPVDILKVPHHGSRTSSTQEFLRWSNPKTAVISQDMRRGHPHRLVLERFQDRGIPTWLTSYGGAVTFWPSSNGGAAASRFPDTGGVGTR